MSTQWEYIQLRTFTETELIFDEQETKEILKFFFQVDRYLVESTQVTNELRNLAQGLLIAAVDASFAMGWVELAFRWSINPGAGVKKALQKLARNAARHWFKHLKPGQSLADVRVYERVRDRLALNFKSAFRLIIEAKSKSQQKQLMACIDCAPPKPHESVWC